MAGTAPDDGKILEGTIDGEDPDSTTVFLICKKAYYFRQTENGVYVRMAIIYHLLHQ